MNSPIRVVSDQDPGGGTDRLAHQSRSRRVLRELSLAVALYGMAGWVYVALCSLTAPQTLSLPLTHVLPYLREDTAGVASFILSFLGFVCYRVTRPET
ncbi:MAG: hypothetical protein ACLPQY_10570 [Streptosporangiaceae bacterium]